MASDDARTVMEAWFAEDCPHRPAWLRPGDRWRVHACLHTTPLPVGCLADLFAELERYKSREQFFAEQLGVPDGGRYRHDWSTRLTTLVAENARLREALRSVAPRLDGTCGPCWCSMERPTWRLGHSKECDNAAALASIRTRTGHESSCPACGGGATGDTDGE